MKTCNRGCCEVPETSEEARKERKAWQEHIQRLRVKQEEKEGMRHLAREAFKRAHGRYPGSS